MARKPAKPTRSKPAPAAKPPAPRSPAKPTAAPKKGAKAKRKAESGKPTKKKAAATKPAPLLELPAPAPNTPAVVAPQPPRPRPLPTGGEGARSAAAARSRDRYAAVAEIGDIPPVQNKERREECRRNLLLYLITYFPNSTGLSPFSDDHERMIARLQKTLLEGGRTLNAVYRGFAKTTITERAALWAVSYGHRKYIPIFSSSRTSANEIIDSIKMELSENDLLAEDFPEICIPVQALEGKAQRAASQTHQGELTHIEWVTDRVVLPTIPGSLASGAIVVSRGLLAASRGTKHVRVDGTVQRPDFVLLDDIQTDQSASSPLQCRKRLGLIKKSILKAAGHRVQLAVALNATVIEPDDLIEQLLDSKRNPGWDGERVPMVRKWSDAHETHWLQEYKQLRSTYDRESPGDLERAREASNQYYLDHRAEMDAGCLVSWESCYDPSTELSAIQHAYNILIDDGEEVFASECQNAPLRNRAQDTVPITAVEITRKLSQIERRQVPAWCDRVAAFVDVHAELLYWTVVACAGNFSGSVIDVGVFPDQRRSRFVHTDPPVPLSRLFPHMGEEGRIFAGLKALLEELPADLASSTLVADHVPLLPYGWERDDGTRLYIGKCPIDSGYQRDAVFAYCGQSKFPSVVLPSKGVGIGAKRKPMSEDKKKPRETVGHNWKIPEPINREVRHVVYDANFYKTFAMRRFKVAIGDPGSLSLFGDDPVVHEHYAEHLTAEYPVLTSGQGREVEEWTLLPGRVNHWLDTTAGALMAQSMLGCAVEGVKAVQVRRAAAPIPEHMRKRK